jgi:hypothetical protein
MPSARETDFLTKPTTNWLEVSAQHVAAFRAREKRAFDRALAYVNGNAWADALAGESEVSIQRTSTNLLFPIVETAMTTLVPRNPHLVLRPRGPAPADFVQGGSALVNYFYEACRFRRGLARSVYHTVMNGLGIQKTTWDVENDRAVVTPVDPRNYFCDMTAQVEEDLKYEIEATLLSRKEMEDRIAAGLYPEEALATAADQYPTWMLPDKRPDSGIEGSGFSRETKNLMNYQSWYLVYEVYDREHGIVYHYTPQRDKPLLADELVYRPYDHLTFNYNGENCRGVSEIGLLLDNQKEYNWTESYLLTILRASIPGIWYDKKATTTDKEQQRAIQMPVGGMAGVDVPNNKNVQEMFFNKPLPQVPPLADQMMAGKRQAIAEVSALAAAQRGQTVGAKTATELAFIKAATQDRLSSRQGDIFDLITRVGGKCYTLAQRYMSEEKLVQITGSEAWVTVNPASLEGMHATFEMSSFSAMETNPAVRAETYRVNYPLLSTNPLLSQKRVTEDFLRAQDLPLTLMLTEEEMAQQAAAAAAVPGPGPGAAAAPPAPTDPTQPPPVEMPNRIKAMAEPMTESATGAPPAPPPPV